MKTFLLALLGCLSALAAAPVEVNLYGDSHATNSEDVASMTVYLPEKSKATGAGVVVVPGGSFLIRCEDQEGIQVAKWLNRHGVAAFVAHYRLIPRYTMQEELDDVRRALQVTRARAGEYGVSPDRIGVIGFSAGAFLAGEAAVKPWEANAAASDTMERVSSRPDFMVLVYGAPGGTNDPVFGFNRYFAEQTGMENWRKLTATTMEQIRTAPPTFMFCTMEDRGAARRMGEFHLQLLQANVSTEAHFFASGPHGVGFPKPNTTLGQWPELLGHWMESKELLTETRSTELAGKVLLDGKPLELGYVVFTPKEKRGLPTRAAYVFNRAGERGSFKFAKGEGVVPGKYSVTVEQMAAKWNSVWAEPLLTNIQAKLNTGKTLSEEDVAKWKEWAAARKYQPTLPDQVEWKASDVVVKGGMTNVVIEAKGK